MMPGDAADTVSWPCVTAEEARYAEIAEVVEEYVCILPFDITQTLSHMRASWEIEWVTSRTAQSSEIDAIRW
jgi:hypothetical protein